MPGRSVNTIDFNLPYSSRAANRIFSGIGFKNRIRMAQDIRTLSAFGGEVQLAEVLRQNGILRGGFSGDLSSIRPQDLNLTVRTKTYSSVLENIGRSLSEQFDADRMQLPAGLAELPNLSRILIGLEMNRQADGRRSQRTMQEGLKLAQMLGQKNFRLEADVNSRIQAIVTEIKTSTESIPDAEVRDTLNRLAGVFEKHIGKDALNEAERYELAQALGEINDIVLNFRHPEEADSPKQILKFGAWLSRLVSLGFMGSVIYLGTNSGYFAVDRAFYFTAAASLGLFTWAAHNFMKITQESENLPNLEFSTDPIAYRDLPREATKRFSNGGLAGGIGALVQDFYLNILTGNHDTILNNDPNNSFYQSTYGDAKQVWRIEKRAAKIEKILRDQKLPLTDRQFRRLAGIMAMEEREVPSHYSLLEATQDAGVNLGKVSRLLWKVGERGGEYASFDAARRMIRLMVPQAEALLAKNGRLLSIIDRMGAGFFLGEEFNQALDNFAAAEGLDPAVRASLQTAFNAQAKFTYLRQSLIEAGLQAKLSHTQAEVWAEKFLSKVQSEDRISSIAGLSKELLYRQIDPAGETELKAGIKREFGLDETQAQSILDGIRSIDLEWDARALNQEYQVDLSARAEIRDLVKTIIFHERTGDARVHEEGNFRRIAEYVINNHPGSYLAQVLGRISNNQPANFLVNPGRQGSMGEKLFLSFVARGLGEKTSQLLADHIITFAAQQYKNAETWENDVRTRGSADRYWEADNIFQKQMLNDLRAEIQRLAGAPFNGETLAPDKVSRVIEVVEGAFSLHEGIFNRTVDGFISLITEDAEGIRLVASVLGGLAETARIQNEVKQQSNALLDRRKALARAILGRDDAAALAEIDPLVRSINELVRKGANELRVEKRFQDGELLSFDSLTDQIPEIIFGQEKLHRTMLDKTNRFQAGTFQQYEIDNKAMTDQAKAVVEKVPAGSQAAVKDAVIEYLDALRSRYATREELMEVLRGESRRLDPHDPRVLRIQQIKSQPADEALLREMHSLESQIVQTRERVKESTMLPLTEIVIEEMASNNPAPLAQRVAARSTDIIMRSIEKESQQYGLNGNPTGRLILRELRPLIEQIGTSTRMPAKGTNDELWSSSIIFERMNYEKWKGSKGSNNDSGLGFYLGERLGVKLYTMLEYLTKEKVMLPPDILANIYREFADKVRLDPNFSADQRLKIENRVMPETIAQDLIERIYNNRMTAEQAVKDLAGVWAQAGLNITYYQLAALYPIASEIAVRSFGAEVLGYVAAREKGTASTHPSAARYLALTAQFANVRKFVRSLPLTRSEKRTLLREARLLRSRLRKNDKIIARTEAWRDRQLARLSEERASITAEQYDRRERAIQEEFEMRLDRRSLFHPEIVNSWYLIPALNQPMSGGDRKKQFIGERLQTRRREFIVPWQLTAEETAARMMTMANNRMPMKKIEKGFVQDYGKAFLDQARAVDRARPAGGFLGKDTEQVAEEMKGVAPYLNTDKHERPLEVERDVVRDVDTDNFLFESSQRKASAYWVKKDGKLIRSYSAILQTQQYYPETYSRFSSTQNEMGLTYSTLMGKAFGKRGKQVIMGCYIVKNRRALNEIADWIEIPLLKRVESEMFDDHFGKLFSGPRKDVAQVRYRKLKLFSEFALAATLAGVGGSFAFSPAGLLLIGGAAAAVGLSKFVLSKNVESGLRRAWGYGILAGTGALVATAIGAGVVAYPAVLAGIAGGLAVRGINLWFNRSGNSAERAFGRLLVPAAVIGASLFNPLAGVGALFGLYHADDMALHLPYHIGYDKRKRIADGLGLRADRGFSKWLLKRQKMTRMYEEEEAYSQPDDVEDFGSSPGVFQRGYHSDFHQSADGVSDDVKDKGTLDGQRGRWHGGMEGNFRPALSAYLWDRQAMPDLDWMRYILQTLGPAGSFARLGLNVNLWSFLASGATAFMFGVSTGQIVTTLLAFSGISFANYLIFQGALHLGKKTHGSNFQKTEDMMAILDALSPINISQGIMRMRYGETPPFLVTKSPHEQVATPNPWPARIFPFPPVMLRVPPESNADKFKGGTRYVAWDKNQEAINSVMMSNRIRWGYILGSLGILGLSIPGIMAGEVKSLFMLPLLIWTGLPIYYSSRGLRVSSQGSSPLGTYQRLQKDEIDGQASQEVEDTRVDLLQQGLKKSAF